MRRSACFRKVEPAAEPPTDVLPLARFDHGGSHADVSERRANRRNAAAASTKTQAVSADGRPPAAASGPAANLQEQEPRVGGRRSEIGAQICQNYVSRAAARPEIIGATS
jgi:hypothetical protein